MDDAPESEGKEVAANFLSVGGVYIQEVMTSRPVLDIPVLHPSSPARNDILSYNLLLIRMYYIQLRLSHDGGHKYMDSTSRFRLCDLFSVGGLNTS